MSDEQKFLVLIGGAIESEHASSDEAIDNAREWLDNRYRDARRSGELGDDDRDVRVVQVLWSGAEQYAIDMAGIDVDTKEQ